MTNRFLRRTAIAMLATVYAVAMAGCYESANVTVTAHKSAAYKGPVDPLMAKLKAHELPKQLRSRLTEASSDR